MPGRAPSRRVDQTIDHVSRGWVPVNPDVLKRVQDKLGDEAYRGDPLGLVQDLKSDPGLFIHAARSLKPLVEDVQTGIDPLEAIKKLEEEKLQKIFAISEKQISAHRLRDMRQTQALRLQHSVISSSAAVQMAQRVDLPANIAFSSAMFRQLGHNLIAWNYPEIYTRAVSGQRTRKQDLDLELKKYLGVTPLQIGAKFATDWNICPEVRATLAQTPPPGSIGARPVHEQEMNEEGRITLSRVCALSELFAQANDPEHYPAAKEAWQQAEASLPDIIDPRFYQDLLQPVARTLAVYDAFAPKELEPTYFPREKIEDELSERARSLFNANVSLRRLPDQLKEKFTAVYAMIRDGNLAVDGLRLLVDEVVPKIGFLRGCLYLVDQKSLNLIPQLRMGDKSLSSYRVVRIHENHPVAQSLASPIPFKQEGEGVDGSSSTHIAGALGAGNKPGVLYLEVDTLFMDDARLSPVLGFQVVRQCLLDCLGSSVQEKFGPPAK